MPYDGNILARARASIEKNRRENEAESARRTAEVYGAIPELSVIDSDIARLMAGIAVRAVDGGSIKAEFAETRSAVEKLVDKKAALLKEHGFAPDYTDSIYTCPDCRDTGFIAGEKCSCLLKAYSVEAKKELSSLLDLQGQSFESFDLSYYPDEADQSGVSPRAVMTETFEFCRDYAYGFKDSSPNLLFRGGTGLGKTFLSACIAGVVSQNGFSVVYDTCVSVLDAFEAQKFGRDESGEATAKVNRCLNCDLLLLDDLGTEMPTSFTQSAVYSLINTRLINRKKTVISTNLTPEELRARYTAATVSRLEGEYIILSFAGKDIRLIRQGL